MPAPPHILPYKGIGIVSHFVTLKPLSSVYYCILEFYVIDQHKVVQNYENEMIHIKS